MSAGGSRFDASVERIEKPWGYELVWALTGRYCGKLLFVRAGEALSLQYHERKEETLYLQTGRAELEIGEVGSPRTVVTVEPGRAFHVPPHAVHRIVALEDSTFLEASTADLDDVVRLEDRYGRAPGTGG
jgi:mannose-6-phosphate isomerase-like protein (cupin superfamily)